MTINVRDYRPDIDGLRAIAVLSVVLYHAGLPYLPGGFVGVDIFFVISGFLITRIIADEIAEGNFSILKFYERRTRRIFPALLVMLSVSIIIASFVALPAELEDFGTSLAAVTLFVSNIYFWQTADYFAGPAHLQPLLHTWSLAVEEQFYIVLPLLLIGLTRWMRAYLIPILIAATLASFVLSVWAVGAKPNAAFYLLPTRFWELMVGALIALGAVPAFKARKWAGAGAAAGLALIVMAAVLYSNATAFPGAAAALPVLGTALIIHAGTMHRDTIVCRMLSLPSVVFVGLVSYSFYLWHWPVLTFTRIARGEILTSGETAMLVVLSFVLAVLSWRFVELPFRERRVLPKRDALFGGACAAMAAMLAFGVFAKASHGWPQRHDGYAPPSIAGLDRMSVASCLLKEDQPASEWAGENKCRHGDPGKPAILVWGDSFAAHLVPGLIDELGHRYRTVQYTAGGCPPVLDVSISNRPFCREFNARVLDEIAQLKPAIVLVSARWDLYMPRRIDAEHVRATLNRIAASGARVVQVGPSPSFDFANPYDFVYRNGRSEARSNPLPLAIESAGSAIAFDPLPLFCEGQVCRLTNDRGYLFYDGGHYSVEGSRLVARMLQPYLSQVTAGRSSHTPM